MIVHSENPKPIIVDGFECLGHEVDGDGVPGLRERRRLQGAGVLLERGRGGGLPGLLPEDAQCHGDHDTLRASKIPLPGGFWVFLGSSRKGLAEIDRGFRVRGSARMVQSRSDVVYSMLCFPPLLCFATKVLNPRVAAVVLLLDKSSCTCSV